MFSTPAKAQCPQLVTGVAQLVPLPTPQVQGSLLKTAARRQWQPESALKDVGNCPVSFARALDHFSLFDKCKELEEQKGTLQDELQQLAQQNRALEHKLAELERNQRTVQEHEPSTSTADNMNDLDVQQMSKAQLISHVSLLHNELIKAQQERRKAHNTLMDMKGNARVYCRVCPTGDLVTNFSLQPDSMTVQVMHGGSHHTFTTNRVFGPSVSQATVFEEVAEFVQSALDGYHVCMFSYGQSGSGKTYNMMGPPDNPGLIPRAIDQVLRTAAQLRHQGYQFSLEASCMEVYNDRLKDLLSSSGSNSMDGIADMNAIKHSENGGHTTVTGIMRVAITNSQQASQLLQQAASARACHATDLNTSSSRSHSVLMLNIQGLHAPSQTTLTGALCLVDLAGSERLERSHAEGPRKKETCAINASLSSLGDVFEALRGNSKHVPYRNSKLTYLLKPCLGPGGKTVMFVHINPLSTYESLTSLRFAVKVAGIERGPAQRRATATNTVTATTAMADAPLHATSASHLTLTSHSYGRSQGVGHGGAISSQVQATGHQHKCQREAAPFNGPLQQALTTSVPHTTSYCGDKMQAGAEESGIDLRGYLKRKQQQQQQQQQQQGLSHAGLQQSQCIAPAEAAASKKRKGAWY